MTRELRRFHSENQHLASPLATQLTKKRLRVPRVDVDDNPFCMERQLADEYERLNFNKVSRRCLGSERGDATPTEAGWLTRALLARKEPAILFHCARATAARRRESAQLLERTWSSL